ncbi:MAG: TonB-dependent receptor [Steroidobacteraceae bacterium]
MWSSAAMSAEEPSRETELEEVQVTGSRIVRRDLDSNSPLVTVESEQLENRSGLNVESYLNQLPSFNPAASPVTSQGDVQITAVNSVGISAVSLRGFGANRNLVLVNGHRATPTNALMVVDINGIPSALIQRVEIISGGASAVYGADAIGGVTNFILKDNFQGLELDAQAGMAEAGDNQERRLSGILGTNFADGRGNVTIGAEYYDRQAALERNRSFYRKSWADPNVASNDLFLFGLNGYNSGTATGSPPSLAAFQAIFADRPAGNPPTTTGVCPLFGGCTGGVRFNPNGTLYNPTGDNVFSFELPIDGVEYAYQTVYDGSQANSAAAPPREITTVKYNNQQTLVSAPQSRYSFFASGKYDITDSIQFFTRANYAESKTRTLLLGTNASSGWEVQMPYNPLTDSPVDPNPALYTSVGSIAAIKANPGAFANPNFIAHGAAGAQHPVPVELALLLNSRGANQFYCLTGSPGCTTANATTDRNLIGTARVGQASRWMMETYPNNSFSQRATLNVNNVWNIESGLRFDLPFGDWTGEAYYSRGQSSTYNVAFGNNSLERWRAVNLAPDYGRNGTFFGNEDGASKNFGTVPAKCTTGFYETIFLGDRPASEDCQYAVRATLQTRTQNQQDNAELNFQGGLFELPAGQVRGAVGFQWRRNKAQFNPDILQSTASFTDQVIGVYPTGYLDAKLIARDVYGELLVPIITDAPFAKKVELELGGRFSDYTVTDSTTTYKALLNWEFNDWVRVRGGFNRATRAPNMGELFLNLQEVFGGGGTFGDPCGLRSNSPFGAGGAAPDPQLTAGEPQTQLASGQTAAGAQSTYLICRAQMGQVAADYLYGGPGLPQGQNAGGATGGGFAWTFQKGNPDLDSETADTWTAGLVFTSRSGNPWLSGINVAFDWWKVDIKDAIQQYSVDYARYLCYGVTQVTTAAEAAAQAATEACTNVGRDTTQGGATTMLLQYDNQATIKTSGYDIAVNWSAMLADIGLPVPGRFGVNVQSTILNEYKTKQSPFAFDVVTDWKGSLGPTLTGTNAGAYSYRVNTSFNYSLNNKNVSLRWRHLPSVWGAAIATERAVIANNESVVAGGPGVVLSYTPSTAYKVRSYDMLDLSFNWSINDMLSMRFGADNFLNLQPRLTGRTRGRPVGTDLAAVCNGAPGCQTPTTYSLPSSGLGSTSPGYYDVLGRRYFLGLKARF